MRGLPGNLHVVTTSRSPDTRRDTSEVLRLPRKMMIDDGGRLPRKIQLIF